MRAPRVTRERSRLRAADFVRLYGYLDTETLRRALASPDGFRCSPQRVEELLALRFVPLTPHAAYLKRFLAGVVAGTDADDCWGFRDGYRDRNGTPMLNVAIDGARRPIGLHRISYSLYVSGEIPADGRLVLRTCHRPECTNPTHLFLGDRQQAVNGSARKGVEHPAALLTEEAVLQIRREHAEGVTYHKLAQHFGVSRATVRDAALGKRWKHVAA